MCKATATERVQTDLREMLQITRCEKFVSTVNRPNLFYEVFRIRMCSYFLQLNLLQCDLLIDVISNIELLSGPVNFYGLICQECSPLLCNCLLCNRIQISEIIRITLPLTV